MKLIAFDPHKRKMVLCGVVKPKLKAIFRTVKPEHFMEVVQGYGIQEIAFEKIAGMKPPIQHIVFKELHTGDTLISDTSTWLDKGRVFDYGHGKQRFLSVKFMRRRKHERAHSDASV